MTYATKLIYSLLRDRRCGSNRRRHTEIGGHGHVLHSQLDEAIDDGVEIFSLSKYSQLLFSGGAPFQNRVDMFNLLARVQFVDYVVNKVQQFQIILPSMPQRTARHLFS